MTFEEWWNRERLPPATPEAFEYMLARAAWEAATAAEREACARVCEEEMQNPSTLWEEPGCWKHAAENCAAAIRAR